ncbi:hypothetical protein Drorol1_Dr00025840 [Drosera rotundifolia]
MASISNTAMMMNKMSPASDQLRIGNLDGVSLRSLVRTRWNRRSVRVSAKLWKRKYEYPWPKKADPNIEGGILRHLSPFKPLKEKPKPVMLDFERPLMELQKKIQDVRKMANETGLDFADQIALLESKYQQALEELYLHLTPMQRVNIARHPNRPTFLDHVFNITETFVELHGDRAGYDDPAIVTGLGTIEGETYMFIGHQKGRNTKENIKRNFGMPTPHGYRKALRMMKYADLHGFPIITFVDTPGAYADLKSEQLGQGEAIARNLFEMFGFEVPMISIVLGEGGSGGALAIACANKLLMLENAVFYVASPEACAAILWKSAKAAPKAAEKLKITAKELCKLDIADGIIPEPLGGAHNDPAWTSEQIKEAILDSMAELDEMDTEELLEDRRHKFRKLGGYEEGTPTDPEGKSNVKKTEGTSTTSIQELESEIKRLEEQVLKATDTPNEASISNVDKLIEKLQRETDLEIARAVAALGFKDRFKSNYDEVAKARASQDQVVVRAAEDKFAKFKDELKQRLKTAPNYATLSKKLNMLRDASKLTSIQELESEMKKLEEQVLKATDTPYEASVSNLDKLIEKLQRETAIEFVEALAALGFKDRYKSTYDEVAKARALQDHVVVRAAEDKFAKFKDELNQRLTTAPNYATLSKKLNMLRDASKLRDPSLKQMKAAPLKEEISKKLKEFMDRADVKERIEKVKAEFLESGASSFDDLDPELAGRVLKLEKEIASELKEFNLDVKIIKRSEVQKLISNLEEVNGQIQKRIEEVASSSDMKKKIDLLRSEVAKAGENPDAELQKKIQDLQQQVTGSLYEALSSSDLTNKLDELEKGISLARVSSEDGGINGAIDGGINGAIDGGVNGSASDTPSRSETYVEG